MKTFYLVCKVTSIVPTNNAMLSRPPSNIIRSNVNWVIEGKPVPKYKNKEEKLVKPTVFQSSQADVSVTSIILYVCLVNEAVYPVALGHM